MVRMLPIGLILASGCLPWGTVYTVPADSGTADTGTAGVVRSLDEVGRGALVVTEVMYAWATSAPYLELVTTAGPVDLAGLVVTGSDKSTFVVPGSLVIRPGDHVVFGPKDLGPRNLDWGEPGVLLIGPQGEVTLSFASTSIDTVQWDEAAGWPRTEGASLSLSALAIDHLANDLPGSWCAATDKIAEGGGDLGTPQLPNPGCPGTR